MLPLNCKIKLPTTSEPGSFGFVRRHDIHTGVRIFLIYNKKYIKNEILYNL